MQYTSPMQIRYGGRPWMKWKIKWTTVSLNLKSQLFYLFQLRRSNSSCKQKVEQKLSFPVKRQCILRHSIRKVKMNLLLWLPQSIWRSLETRILDVLRQMCLCIFGGLVRASLFSLLSNNLFSAEKHIFVNVEWTVKFPSFLHMQGRFGVFVYNDCVIVMICKWKILNDKLRAKCLCSLFSSGM